MLSRDRRQLSAAVLAISAALVVLGPTARFADYVRQRGRLTVEEPAWWARILDLSTEANLPTWWATMLLAALAAIFVLVASLQRLAGEAAGPYWLLAGVAVALSIDEGTGFHEVVLGAIGDGLVDGGGLLHFTWTIPGAVLASAVGLLLLRTSRVLPSDVRRTLAVGGAVFLTGALGVEAVSGAVLDARGHDRWYLLVTTIEEAAELAGVLLALHGASRLVSVRAHPPGSPAGGGWAASVHVGVQALG